MNTILKILFILIYLIIITPLGLILRACGIDYLERMMDKNASSYWLNVD